jgi:SAM-dependent methyltransferase
VERSEYAFRDREREQRRLRNQAELFEPLTERAFRAAGLGAGMRVLDLGSGAGDVAMLAARLAGPDGEVVGVERDPAAVQSATARAREAGFANVRFVQGDAQALDSVAGPFDAVVGRLVLMYLPDPVAAVARAAELVRPGGLVCCQEGDMAYEWAQPMTALWTQVRAWFLETLSRARIPHRMGLALPATFTAAGLPPPELRLECALGAGERMPAWGWSEVLAGLMPVMEQLGVATADEVQPGTLEQRLLTELDAAQGVVLGPPLIAAWSRKPR